MGMLHELWTGRVRHPLGRREWLRTWAKRVLLLPVLLRQWRYHALLRRKGAQVHGTAYFSDARLITGGAVRALTVGDESFVGRVEVSAHAMVTIGRRVCINDGAKILTASHDISDPGWCTRARAITINDYAWVATNAILLPGVTVGQGAVVGAGAVVARDVPDYGVVVGNPARALEQCRCGELNYSPVRCLALHEAWLGRSSKAGGN